MDGYFVDKDVLEVIVGKMIDFGVENGIAAFALKSDIELARMMGEAVKKLDDKICDALFDSLDVDQLEEIEDIMDHHDSEDGVYDRFFEKHNIDLEQLIKSESEAFAKEFLGKDVHYGE